VRNLTSACLLSLIAFALSSLAHAQATEFNESCQYSQTTQLTNNNYNYAPGYTRNGNVIIATAFDQHAGGGWAHNGNYFLGNSYPTYGQWGTQDPCGASLCLAGHKALLVCRDEFRNCQIISADQMDGQMSCSYTVRVEGSGPYAGASRGRRSRQHAN
jgi:hypothetical protein